MRRFEYIRPSSVAEATGFLAANPDDSLVVAGGTAAVVLLDMGVLRPQYVVDLGGLSELRDVRDGNGLELGALTTIRWLERDPAVQDSYPLLAEAASQVANVRVRNMATVGGTVSYGEPQTDTPSALIALDANVSIAGQSGSRSMPLEHFFRGPYETALEPGEIVTAISLPPALRNDGGCHVKFTVGSPENKPVANASALLGLDQASGRLAEARIVMGAVGPVAVVATNAMERLREELPTDALFAEAARLAAEQSDPQDDVRGPVWYKRRIIRVLVERALQCALQRARQTTRAA